MHFVREILLRNVKYLRVCGFILFHLMHSIKFHNYKVNYFIFAVSKYFIIQFNRQIVYVVAKELTFVWALDIY